MKRIKLYKNRYVGDEDPCFIIAEAGSNHDCDFAQAKRLVEIAAEARADAVKFQLFKAEDLYPANCGKIETTMGKIDFFEALKNMELSSSWLTTLKKYANKCGLEFICTPFSEKAAKIMHRTGIKVYKIASPELNHLPLLKFISKYNLPIILSTGISKLGDIEEAIETCVKEGNNKIILLHCVSAYPTPLSECNLNVINTLKIVFNRPVGLSDHTLSFDLVPSIAVAAGANVIEKHFTVSRKLRGLDHPFALEPSELKQMVKEIRKIEKISSKKRFNFLRKKYGLSKVNKVLGTAHKTLASSEEELYICDRRSLRVSQKIMKGELLTKKNVDILRSERNLQPGLHPRYFELVLDKKAKKSLGVGQEICWGDFKF